MTDAEIVTKHCPLCVNIQRLASYLLADDEVILFDWLTVKQSLVFGYKPFYYSLDRIEKETRLKRRRIERVIKRFCAMGLLQVATSQKLDSPGRVRYFRMNFRGVIGKLPEIIDQESDNAEDFKRYFKALANIQERAERGKESKREREDREHAEEIYNSLNGVYWERIDMFNAGRLTGEKPERVKTKIQLPKDNSIIEKLKSLSSKYDDGTICDSFTVLCDEFLIGAKAVSKVDNLVKYFLTYKPEIDSFSIVDLYITKFQKNYSQGR